MLVVERRDGARLAQKPVTSLAIRGQLGRQGLDGDLAIEPGVSRPVDLPHPARTDPARDPEVAERS